MTKNPKSLFLNLTYLLLSTILLTSCKDNEDPQPEKNSEGTCFKKETLTYRDGVLAGNTEYRYNTADLLEVELFVDVSGQITDSAHYTYNASGLLIREYRHDRVNLQEQERVYEYDSLGEEILSEITINGGLTGRYTTFRDENSRIDSMHVLFGAEETRRIYTYENDLLIRISELNKAGIMLRKREYTYTGNRTEIVSYSESNTVITRTEIEKDDKGREISWKTYDFLDQLVSLREIKYDERGNVVQVRDEFTGTSVIVNDTSWECR